MGVIVVVVADAAIVSVCHGQGVGRGGGTWGRGILTLVAHLIAIVIQRAFIVITKAKQWQTCCCVPESVCVCESVCLVWHDVQLQQKQQQHSHEL